MNKKFIFTLLSILACNGFVGSARCETPEEAVNEIKKGIKTIHLMHKSVAVNGPIANEIIKQSNSDKKGLYYATIFEAVTNGYGENNPEGMVNNLAHQLNFSNTMCNRALPESEKQLCDKLIAASIALNRNIINMAIENMKDVLAWEKEQNPTDTKKHEQIAYYLNKINTHMALFNKQFPETK